MLVTRLLSVLHARRAQGPCAYVHVFVIGLCGSRGAVIFAGRVFFFFIFLFPPLTSARLLLRPGWLCVSFFAVPA
jgi:hypothetical protein